MNLKMKLPDCITKFKSENKEVFQNTETLMYILVIFFFSLLCISCKENSNEFTIGEKYIESQTDLSLVDTFSVSLSTVILDTVTTSGKGSLLIGNFQDNIFGKVLSNSYFQVGIPGDLDLFDDADEYDSLSLVIKYNNYSFGDTTKNQKILVHKLTENIKFNDNNVITGNATFNYNPEPIGSLIYTPAPNSTIDSISIKISDVIGLDLFSKIKSNSEILEDNESFINYFHGLVLITDEAYKGSIIGFNAADTKLILYTSRNGEIEEEINYEFALEDTTMQFNNIKHDFSSTKLNQLVVQKDALSSSKTDGLAFLQGCIGLALRVDFPSLEGILLRSRGTVIKAEFLMAPLIGGSNDFDLPSNLVAYYANKLNQISSSVSNSTFNKDELYNEQTAYSFDITDYLIYELNDSYVDSDNGLLINLTEANQANTFERLIIDSKNQNTKLKIYYLSY